MPEPLCSGGNTIPVPCSVHVQKVLGPVALATETLRADSRAVLCCLQHGRLTFEGWLVVVKE